MRTPAQASAPWIVLLAGGRGTRFWPASRAARPKQFLRLIGGKTLLRLTWERFARIVPAERILVVTGTAYAGPTREELPDLPPANLIVEPSGKDTAPAAALASRVLLAREENPLLVVSPTDHWVGDADAFAAALRIGLEAARSGSLVVFGVTPDRPESGYGYIEIAGPSAGVEAVPIARFREKPSPKEAASYLATGRFYWNAGIFAWRAKVFEGALAAASPELASALSGLPHHVEPDERGFETFRAAWEALPAISIDYAVMERAAAAVVVPLRAAWSDVGGWEALGALLPGDAQGNRAAEGAIFLESRDCSVHRALEDAPPRFHVLVGIEGLIVVETDDAVLICRKGAGESMRNVVAKVRAENRDDLL